MARKGRKKRSARAGFQIMVILPIYKSIERKGEFQALSEYIVDPSFTFDVLCIIIILLIYKSIEKREILKRTMNVSFIPVAMQEQRMEFTKELEQNYLISSVTTYTDLLDLQKQLFKSQIQQLKYLVKTHRELTGVNPLSQEMVAGPLLIKTVAPADIDKVQPDLEELDKHFIDEKIALMKKEKSFSGQVKLMESILQIENPSVLSWLLIKGGLMILATWLSQAAMEEQTSVLNIILKVLHILPLQMAFLAQKTIIYKIVTKLQFYWTPGLDISKSARTLLTKWSNMSAKSQDSKDGKSQSVMLSETQDPREVQMVENPDQSTTVKIPKLEPHQEYIVLSDSDDEAPQQEGRNQVPDFIPEHLIKYWHFVADPRNWRDQKNRSGKSTRLIQGQEASGEGSSSKNYMAGEGSGVK